MENLGQFEEKIAVDSDVIDAINEEIFNAYALMQIDKALSPSKTVEKIRGYLDVLLPSSNANLNDNDKLKNLDVTIGSLWGDSVCKEYKWTWVGLKEKDNEYPAFYVVSPNNKCCIPPFGFIHKIISQTNEGLDGHNDNTTMLLFNMLNGIESQFSDKEYQVLM